MRSGAPRTLDEAMGDFFVECQRLLNEGLIEPEILVRLRNALYGPSVEPIDVDQYALDRAAAHEWLRRQGR